MGSKLGHQSHFLHTNITTSSHKSQIQNHKYKYKSQIHEYKFTDTQENFDLSQSTTRDSGGGLQKWDQNQFYNIKYSSHKYANTQMQMQKYKFTNTQIQIHRQHKIILLESIGLSESTASRRSGTNRIKIRSPISNLLLIPPIAITTCFIFIIFETKNQAQI